MAFEPEVGVTAVEEVLGWFRRGRGQGGRAGAGGGRECCESVGVLDDRSGNEKIGMALAAATQPARRPK